MKHIGLCAALGLVIVLPLKADAPDAKKTISWMQALQQTDGGFFPYPKGSPGAEPKTNLRTMSGAIRALKYWGGDVPNKDQAAKFVAAAFDPTTGGFLDIPGAKPDVATTAVGLMVVVELKMPRDKYVEPASKFLAANAKTFEDVRIAAAGLETVENVKAAPAAWMEQVVKMSNADGTYGEGKGQARLTGSAVVTVLRLGGEVEKKDNVLKALKAGQRADGGFGKADADGSDLETTYRVMRAFHMLKDKPADVKALQSFIEKCRHADGGYGIAPGQPPAVGPTYFSGIIMHWLGE